MTINIYDNSGDYSRLEFMNNGENAPDEMVIKICIRSKKEELFNLSKDDARDLVKYLKKEFKFSIGEF